MTMTPSSYYTRWHHLYVYLGGNGAVIRPVAAPRYQLSIFSNRNLGVTNPATKESCLTSCTMIIGACNSTTQLPSSTWHSGTPSRMAVVSWRRKSQHLIPASVPAVLTPPCRQVSERIQQSVRVCITRQVRFTELAGSHEHAAHAGVLSTSHICSDIIAHHHRLHCGAIQRTDRRFEELMRGFSEHDGAPEIGRAHV